MIKEIQHLYPIRLCEYEDNEGVVTVKQKLMNGNFLTRLFGVKDKELIYRIDLDEIGSFIYPICDGKNTIAEIIVKTEERFGERVLPANERVTLFIKQMKSRKLIELFQKTGDA